MGKRIVKFVKEHVGLCVLVLAISLGLSLIIYKKCTALTPYEQINFAVTAFAHHGDGKEKDFLNFLDSDEIKDVNLSYFDISDSVEMMSEYLLTYGYHFADVFIIDTSLGQSVLKDCFYAFSQNQIKELSELVDFELKFVQQGEIIEGIVVHEKGNDSYNSHFPLLNDWLLFEADGEEYSFAIFFNADSAHNGKGNFDLLKYLLK